MKKRKQNWLKKRVIFLNEKKMEIFLVIEYFTMCHMSHLFRWETKKKMKDSSSVSVRNETGKQTFIYENDGGDGDWGYCCCCFFCKMINQLTK